MLKKNMLITIITVCYNAEEFIAKTINAVLEQTYENIEYIIKDGESTDRTNEIAESYRAKLEQRGIRFVHMIQKDSGIYDAMNQATDIASGEYINYMNADDIFFDSNVLTDIFENRTQTADLLYGDSVREHKITRKKREYTIWKGQHHNFDGMPFNHQACFFKTDLMKKYHYDCRYKIAADFHIISRFFMDNRIFCNVDRIISIYTMDGLSNTHMKASYSEAIQVKKELNMEAFMLHDTPFNMWIIDRKQWILDTLPWGIVGRLMRFQLKRKGIIIYSSLEQIRRLLQ